MRFAIRCLGLALLFTPFVSQAQFSGPSLDNTTEVNRPTTITTDPAILFPADREIMLGAGDQLAIHLYGSIDYAPVVRVSLDGSIDLPLAGNVHVKDLSIHQAEHSIAQRLSSLNMYVDPQVTIQVLESPNQVVTVTGETHGIVPAVGKRRLFDALSLAGGLPPTASHIVTIQRPGLDQPINVDLGTDPGKSVMSNVPVFAGDTVIVSRVGVIYTLGAFRSQTAIPLIGNSPFTLLQAMSMGGGPNFEGKKEDARVIRTVGTKRVEVKVNMKRIMDGKDVDPVLQADDIVYLPTSAFKAAVRSGGIATLIGLASFLTYSTGMR